MARQDGLKILVPEVHPDELPEHVHRDSKTNSWCATAGAETRPMFAGRVVLLPDAATFFGPTISKVPTLHALPSAKPVLTPAGSGPGGH